MKFINRKIPLALGLGLLVNIAALLPGPLCAQYPYPFVPPPPVVPPQTPMAQQNAFNIVLNDVNWLQNATRNTVSIGTGGYGLVSQRFDALRADFGAFKSTLTPQQVNAGANQLAELDAGLDIIAEAFTDYQTAVANGQSPSRAFRNMCRVISQAIAVWTDEFRRDCRQLHVGW